MKKHIIWNCPANNTFWGCRGDKKLKRHCKDITDCVLKRIANECKWETSIDVNVRGDLAERILSELEIEECENE